MLSIKQGDVRNIAGLPGWKFIAHCCNDIGSFGSGVAGAIAEKWPHVRQGYIDWFNSNKNFDLGQMKVEIADKVNQIAVCNIIGQHGIGHGERIAGVNIPPVRYEAIREGLLRVKAHALNWNSLYSPADGKDELISVHAPLLGCGLAGGKLDKIYGIVKEVFGDGKVDFTFYAFSDKDYADLQNIY